MNSNSFHPSELIRVGPPRNPKDLRFIVPGAIVWLASGSPPMEVIEVYEGEASVMWIEGIQAHFDVLNVACLTPEPTPI